MVDSACHPSEVSKMSASLLVSCVGMEICPGLCPIAKDTAKAAPTLCTEYGPDGCMDGWVPSDDSNAGLYLFGLQFDLNLIYFNPILNSIE